jgi:hypothetical protein
LDEENMNEETIHGDSLEDAPRFVPCSLFEKFGIQRVFYKGKDPKVRETKQEVALAEVAEKKWQYYKDTFRPLEDEYMKQVGDMDSDGARQFATGTAASATTAAFGDAHKRMESSLQDQGVNPNSGKYKTSVMGLADAEAMSSADNKSRALTSQEDAYVGGLTNVSAIGRGQSTTAQAGLSDLARSSSTKAASDAGNAYNNRASLINAAGSVFGAGAEKYYESMPDKKVT